MGAPLMRHGAKVRGEEAFRFIYINTLAFGP
jgi:hypothetical protein